MLNSVVIEVAIGLALIFLLVSMLISAVAEMIAGFMKWRSTHLWDGLEHLLQSSAARDALYAHPLVKGLCRVAVVKPDWQGGKNGPSYLPSRTFALVMIDILRRPQEVAQGVEQRLRAAIHEVTDPEQAFAALEKAVTALADSKAGDAVREKLAELRTTAFPPVEANVVKDLKDIVSAAVASVPEQDRAAVAEKVVHWIEQSADQAATYFALRGTLVSAINAMPFAALGSPAEQLRLALHGAVAEFAHGKPEDAAREIETFAKNVATGWLQEQRAGLEETLAAVTPLLHDAAGETERFRENLEIWFNSGMDRVSGWYKRHMLLVNGAIAFVLVAAMNIDALQITRTLWREPVVRASLVAEAERFVDEDAASVQDPSDVTATSDGALRVTADDVRLSPGERAKFSLILAKAVGADTPVTVTSPTSSALVAAQEVDTGGDKIVMTLEAGQSSGEFIVKPGEVVRPVLVTLSVTAGNISVSPAVVILPAADKQFTELQQRISTLGLPIGWSCADSNGTTVAMGGPPWCSWPNPLDWKSRGLQFVAMDYLSMLFGWAITVAATSLGAPFWFDLLKRLVNIRAGGRAPEERLINPKEVSQPTEPGQRPKEADLLNALKS